LIPVWCNSEENVCLNVGQPTLPIPARKAVLVSFAMKGKFSTEGLQVLSFRVSALEVRQRAPANLSTSELPRPDGLKRSR
jgi:hypothetical protein